MENRVLEYPRLNIIFDSRRHEKLEPLLAELSRQSITDYEIFPCIIYPDVVKSINASHKMIVQRAKDDGLKEVCIGEDDLCFPSENGWRWFLENKPSTFDIYSAGCYMSFERPSAPGLVKFKTLVGFHLYIVSERYYDKFLATRDDDHIDTAQRGGEFYSIWPFAALQSPGYSANNKINVNYNLILTEQDIYR